MRDRQFAIPARNFTTTFGIDPDTDAQAIDNRVQSARAEPGIAGGGQPADVGCEHVDVGDYRHQQSQHDLGRQHLAVRHRGADPDQPPERQQCRLWQLLVRYLALGTTGNREQACEATDVVPETLLYLA